MHLLLKSDYKHNDIENLQKDIEILKKIIIKLTDYIETNQSNIIILMEEIEKLKKGEPK